MITTKKKITNIDFATTNIGVISIGVRTDLNAILLQQINREVNKPVGEYLENSEVQDLPKVYLNFTNTDSIDILIRHLETLKEHMKYPYGCYAYAC